MAKIKFSALVSAASGKMGGIVFSRNANGAYVKDYAPPVNANTVKQAQNRATFGALTTTWKSLSESDRTSWADMAPQYPYQNSLGDTKVYTGQQLFMKLNMSLKGLDPNLSIDKPLVPPTVTNLDFTAMTGTVALGVSTITLTCENTGTTDEKLIIRATPPMSAGVTRVPDSMYRVIDTNVDASVGDEYLIGAAYDAYYGAPAVGAKIGVEVILVSETTGFRLKAGNGQIVMS